MGFNPLMSEKQLMEGFYGEPRWSLENAIELREIYRRRRVVSRAKRAKEMQGLGCELTEAELDQLLPPIDCERSRCRAAGIPYRKETFGGRPSKVTPEMKVAIRRDRGEGTPLRVLVERYQLSAPTISRIANRRREYCGRD